MNVPENLKYTKSHEWIRLEGDIAFIGITDFAQDNLGDIVYIELPESGLDVKADEELTTIESVKAAEPIYSPLDGKIVKVNEDLNDSPDLMNRKPYDAFIFALELSDTSAVEGLLSSSEYTVFAESEAES
jgi:glycine cleavage system H protein